MASALASTSISGENSTADASSDEECLASLKRKTTNTKPLASKRRKYTNASSSQYPSSVEVKIEYASDDDNYVPQNLEDYLNAASNTYSQETQYAAVMMQSPAERSQRAPRRKLYPCECGTVFTDGDELRKHWFEYHNYVDGATSDDIAIPIHKCSKCGKCYRTECELNTHLQYHTEGNVQICEVCHRRFQSIEDLERHMMNHEKHLYKCVSCPEKYHDKQLLDEHYRKKHVQCKSCPICASQFISRDELSLHMNTTHQLAGTTLCLYCGQRFPTSHEKDTHIADVHGEEELGCEKCGERYYCKCIERIENGQELDDLDEGKDVDPLAEEYDGHENVQNSTDDKKRSKADLQRLGHNEVLLESSNQLYVQCMYNVPVKREDLSYPTQCAIVTKMHKGKSVADICSLYHLTPEIVNEIWDERDNFIVPKKIGMKSSKYMNSVLDAKILEWFAKQKDLGIQVTGKMLINMAEEYAKECGFVVFNGNIKWLDRFKTRHKISLRPNQNKRDKIRAPNDAKWKEQFLTEIWPEVSKGYEFDDIYTADEIGVYYNPSKGRIRKHTGRKFIHGFPKDRFAVFMCTNMTGNDRRKLLVCGSEDPLPHSHRSPDTLPVSYIRHSQAHFTTPMFEDYVKCWDAQLRLHDKKAMLILDRASIHTKLSSLSNLKLIFVPWKASVGLMPIRHGIYVRFRDEFRKLVLQEKAFNAMRGIDRNLTCLEGLELLHKAWWRIPRGIVISSFEVIGYKVPDKPKMDVKTPKVTDDDDERICKMLDDFDVDHYYTDLGNIDMYLTVDEELLTAQGTHGSVFGGNHKTAGPVEINPIEKGEILPIAANKTDMVEREKLILKARALEDLELVRKFLEANKTSVRSFNAFMDIEKFLLRNPPKIKD